PGASTTTPNATRPTRPAAAAAIGATARRRREARLVRVTTSKDATVTRRPRGTFASGGHGGLYMAMADWVARDAAVVWHGFTQMSCYADNGPIIVDRAEGRELIDVDGRRYLDAISSLWVTTLGHRVPELDDALRRQLDLVAPSTMLGNGNRVVIELAEALAEVVPIDQPHFLFASDGASAIEQALKVAFQYWTNKGVAGRTGYLAFGGAYHGDTVGGLSLGDGGFGTAVVDPLRFPVVRAPAF